MRSVAVWVQASSRVSTVPHSFANVIAATVEYDPTQCVQDIAAITVTFGCIMMQAQLAVIVVIDGLHVLTMRLVVVVPDDVQHHPPRQLEHSMKARGDLRLILQKVLQLLAISKLFCKSTVLPDWNWPGAWKRSSLGGT